MSAAPFVAAPSPVVVEEPLDRDTFQGVLDAWSPALVEATRQGLRDGTLAPAAAVRPLVDPAAALHRLRSPLLGWRS